jgi:hypothetical protein
MAGQMGNVNRCQQNLRWSASMPSVTCCWCVAAFPDRPVVVVVTPSVKQKNRT